MFSELHFLFLLTVTLTSILLILLGYLIIRKINYIHDRKKIDLYKKKYNQHLFQYLTEGGDYLSLKPKTMLQLKAIEELFYSYVNVLEGEQPISRLSEISGHYLTDYYRKCLRSKKWSKRMNALYNVEDFQITALLPDVYSLTKKKRLSHEELVHVLRILGSFQYQDIFNLLTIHYNYLSEYEYRNILLRLNENHFDQFLLNFHKSSPPLKNAILGVISIKKDRSYLTFTEHIFVDYSGEVRLRALKALAEIGQVNNIEHYLPLLNSSQWEERMIAAKLIGTLKEQKGIPGLIDLLHDKTWWVRSQAGRAITMFPNGKYILQYVFISSKDAFAKEMAWEWLHKGV